MDFDPLAEPEGGAELAMLAALTAGALARLRGRRP